MTTVNKTARKTEYKAHMEPHVTQIHRLMSPQNYGCKIISEERERFNAYDQRQHREGSGIPEFH
jgi:hypothetical protein